MDNLFTSTIRKGTDDMKIILKAFLYTAFGWLAFRHYQPNTVFVQTVHID